VKKWGEKGRGGKKKERRVAWETQRGQTFPWGAGEKGGGRPGALGYTWV